MSQRFKIAISFAGDGKRDKVRKIAEKLREALGDDAIFFDEWYEAEIAGADADTVLQDIYLNKTLLVVSCVCERYDEKPWTADEWRAIRSFERKTRNTERERFLPVRFGPGEVSGIFDTAIVPDVQDRSEGDVSELILKRLKLVTEKVIVDSNVGEENGSSQACGAALQPTTKSISDFQPRHINSSDYPSIGIELEQRFANALRCFDHQPIVWVEPRLHSIAEELARDSSVDKD